MNDPPDIHMIPVDAINVSIRACATKRVFQALVEHRPPRPKKADHGQPAPREDAPGSRLAFNAAAISTSEW
jgi:hypothetical protein